MSNKLLTGSQCLTDIIERAREKHSAFNKGKNGKIYFNVNVWINEEEDQYGNIASVQLSQGKDADDGRPYIGNLKEWETKSNEVEQDDLPTDEELAF